MRTFPLKAGTRERPIHWRGKPAARRLGGAMSLPWLRLTRKLPLCSRGRLFASGTAVSGFGTAAEGGATAS